MLQVDGTNYFVRYTGKSGGGNTRKKARWVDLELPPTEKTSWWRLDGYDTDATGESTSAEESDEESDDEELGEEDSNDGEEMDEEE